MGEWLSIIRFEPLTFFFKGITLLGNEYFFCLSLPLIYWCWKKRFGAHIIILTIISAYISFMLKGFFAWERPPTDLWLVNESGYSFPSTHAVTAAIVWGCLIYEVRKKWFTISALSLIALIAFSRVYLGVHYPQDVLAGLALGALLLHLYRWVIICFGPRIAAWNTFFKGLAIALVSITLLLIQPSAMAAAGAGLLAGIGTGLLLEPYFADFDPRGKWYQNIIKSVLGLLLSLAIWQGFEWTLSSNSNFDWFQFFVIGLWVMAGAPWLFVQLRLASREL